MLDFFQIFTTFYQVLIALANLSRCRARESLELLRQMTLAGKADL
jgi:hypothetical protein